MKNIVKKSFAVAVGVVSGIAFISVGIRHGIRFSKIAVQYAKQDRPVPDDVVIECIDLISNEVDRIDELFKTGLLPN